MLLQKVAFLLKSGLDDRVLKQPCDDETQDIHTRGEIRISVIISWTC